MIVLNYKDFLEEESIRNQTLKGLYHFIHRYGPISKTDLLKSTNIKQTTLVRMIDELLQNQFIYESGLGQSTGGRPPVLYEIVPHSGYIIGIDISRISTIVVITDLNFNVIDKVSFEMGKGQTPKIVIDRLKSIITKFIESYQQQNKKIIGIGIGSVGPLDRKRGIILNPESFAGAGWNNVFIVDQLTRKFSVNVLLENGANTAALGEYYRVPNLNNNILYCISGVGFRCGMLVNGQIVRNQTGDASAFGHMIINFNGNKCVCGKSGCLLSYISLDAISQQIKHFLHAGERSVLNEWLHNDFQKISFEHIIKACKFKDDLVEKVVLGTAGYYGIGIANVINLMNPEHVILSGPLFYEQKSYFKTIVDAAKQYIFHPYKNTVTFTKGKLKEDAVAIGAAAMMFDSFFKDKSHVKKGDFL